jgi:hypothetical protein
MSPKPPSHISQRALLGEVTSQVILRMADGSVGDGMREDYSRSVTGVIPWLSATLLVTITGLARALLIVIWPFIEPSARLMRHAKERRKLRLGRG